MGYRTSLFQIQAKYWLPIRFGTHRAWCNSSAIPSICTSAFLSAKASCLHLDFCTQARFSTKSKARPTYILRFGSHWDKTTFDTGIGIEIYDADNGTKLWGGRRFIPVYSHHAKEKISRNQRDYIALVDGLKVVNSLMKKKFGDGTFLSPSGHVEIQTANRCIFKQLTGDYKVHGALIPLHEHVTKLMSGLETAVVRVPAVECAYVQNESTLAVNEQTSSESYTSIIEKNDTPKAHRSKNATAAATVSPEKVYILRFDGGCRGNPGIAGCGMALYDSKSGSEIWSGYQYLGDQRIYQIAEYIGLITGMQSALSLGVKKIVVQGDSMLLFRQIAPGKHERPKGHLLKQFYFDAQALKKKFETFNMVHISRDLNTRADELANKAMDTKSSHVSIYA